MVGEQLHDVVVEFLNLNNQLDSPAMCGTLCVA